MTQQTIWIESGRTKGPPPEAFPGTSKDKFLRNLGLQPKKYH